MIEPDWIQRARDAWGAKVPAPLRVRAWLHSPVSIDPQDSITLDAALGWAVVLRVTGRMPDDVFAGVPSGVTWPIATPIEEVPFEVDGRLLYVPASSAAMPAPTALHAMRQKRKRTHPEALKVRGRVQTAGGRYKTLDIPVQSLVTPYLEWSVRADEARLRELLPLIHNVGRARGAGLGTVLGWEVDDDPLDGAFVVDGIPQRPIPVASYDDARARFRGDYDVRMVGFRGPYWHYRNKALCACPLRLSQPT